MILAFSALALVAWIYLIVFHGGFWRSWPVIDARAPSATPAITIVVPARNEAEGIRQSLASLLRQDYRGQFTILLIDDNSTDGTAAIAASLSSRERLSILAGTPLPPGWSGKLWAVHQALAHQNAKAADYILLTDADIEHAPDHLSSLVARAEAHSLDLVSEMVRLHCVTSAERALVPAFVFFFQMLYPFARVANPKRRVAGAAGGTMLVSRAALDRIRGVSTIRHCLIDDCALAKQIKTTGGHIWLGHTERAVSLRVYSHSRDVWNMIARTAYEQLSHSPLMLLGCVLGMGVVFCVPPLLTCFAHGLPRQFGLLSWLIMAIAYQPTLRRYRRSPLWGLALPCISLYYLCATVASAFRNYAGRGGDWKNRVYPESSSS